MPLWKPLRPLAWAAFRATSQSYLLLSRRQYRYVFILGHMRSGSTLLTHIFSSHPDFAGAGETHISYKTPDDLPTLVLRTSEFLHRPILRKRYVVDQINHEYVSDDVLRSEQLHKSVILIRQPGATLKSMMNLFKCNEKSALESYVDRLAALTRYGLLLGRRAVLVNYDDLVDYPEQTLAALTRFFELDSPLGPNYTTHRMTARIPGVGDPSGNIKSGKVMRTQSHEGIAISSATLEAAEAAFHKCCDELLHLDVVAAVDAGPWPTLTK